MSSWQAAWSRRQVFAGATAVALSGATSAAAQGAPAASKLIVRELRVPMDHGRAGGDDFVLKYALLAPFDARRKTVFVVADGQQFYVSPQAFAPSVGPLFGDRFNVVGVFGRADAPEVQARLGAGADIDWREAYRLLKAEQWIGDLDAVRRALVGDGPIGLYGRSGGAFLVHQFMARHGAHVDRVFTQAAVNPFLEARFGITSDRFWSELGAEDQARLSKLLASGRYPRTRIATLFQRQNFFVARSKLAEERTALIADLVAGREDSLRAREGAYQIDAIAKLAHTPRGIATNVRLFEFFAPVSGSFKANDAALYPDLEVSAQFAEPLMPLLQSGAIPMPTMDFGALHGLRAEVFLVAGRWDHTCDYRTQIALAASYPRGRLALLNDDHVFHALQSSGQTPAIIQKVFSGSPTSIDEALAALSPLRWTEVS